MARPSAFKVYDRYYSRIQGLLFEGKSLKETYEYIEKYFETGFSYKRFYAYVKDRKLYWYMPSYVPKPDKKRLKEIEAEKRRKRREASIKKKEASLPIGCKFPNCFYCIFHDCLVNEYMPNGYGPEELYEITRNLPD